MIEINPLGPTGAVQQDEMEKERHKEIKARLGKMAFEGLFGEKAKATVSNGISRSQGALKWIEGFLEGDQWKNS
jgi:hypothetical protein